MAISAGIAAVSVVASTSAAQGQASAAKAQAEYQAKQARQNAELLEIQKREILTQGNDQAVDMSQQVSQLIGSQKVSLAAQGIEIDSGSAFDLQEEARNFGQQDIETIRNNAKKQAWGISIEQENLRKGADFTERAGEVQANNIMLANGLSAVNTAGNVGNKSYTRKQQTNRNRGL